MNDNITDHYIKYFTIVILIIGFIYGALETFSILVSYKVTTDFAYNNICIDEFGQSYSFSSFNKGTITCQKQSDQLFTIKRKAFLLPND